MAYVKNILTYAINRFRIEGQEGCLCHDQQNAGGCATIPIS